VPTFRSFADFGAAVASLGRELETSERAKITRDMAEKAQDIARRAASADLGGDPKFSGWAPPLDTRIRRLTSGDHLMTPTGRSAGPWTVAEQGRNQGGSSGFAGPGINRTTGLTARTKSGALRKVRGARSRRWNGYTQGKNTASDAVARMERELPPVAERGVRRAIRKRFDVT
jgi:hypothetical protein